MTRQSAVSEHAGAASAVLPPLARTDRRSARTRAALRDALAAEIEASGDLSLVTVTAVADRAGVTRRSFYTHFRDISDLVGQVEDWALAELADRLRSVAQVTLVQCAGVLTSYAPAPGTVELLGSIRANGALWKALLGEGGDASFAERVKALAYDIVAPRALHGLDERARGFFDYYLTYAISAEVGVLTRWLAGGMRESEEVMARIMTVLAFVRPGDLYGIPINLDISAYSEALARRGGFTS